MATATGKTLFDGMPLSSRTEQEVMSTNIISETLRFVRFPYGLSAIVSRNHSDHWWETQFPKWELSTFRAFGYYVQSNGTYVGFGEWIGPTILFAAQIAQRAFALEPDVYARPALETNILLNPSISKHTVVSPLCISNVTTEVIMAGIGGSGSYIRGSTFYTGKPLPEFNVECVRLPTFLREHSIDSGNLFIKVDTEGAEWFIIPSLFDFLSGMAVKPTFFISLHGSQQADPRQHESFARVMRLFRYAGIYDGSNPVKSAGSTFTADMARMGGDIIASDFSPSVERIGSFRQKLT